MRDGDSWREAQALGEWLSSDRFEWETFATLTFDQRWGPTGPSPDRCLYHVRRWLRSLAHKPRWFLAVERGTQGARVHAHALIGPGRVSGDDSESRWAPGVPGEPLRRELWAVWKKRFGRARFEPINEQISCAHYCAKYLVKAPLHWDMDA